MSRQQDESIGLTVADADSGARLDRFLAARLPELSRARVQSLIRAGAVCRAGNAVMDPGYRVKSGERYEVRVPAAEPTMVVAEAIPLAVVYEDGELLVIDKPSGLVVHPAAGHATGTLVNALLAHCGASLSGIGGIKRPGIVHRLDKDTSGLIVVAKTDAAHRHLAEQFAEHGRDGRLERGYVALAWGAPESRRGTIDAPLGRSGRNRTKIAVVRSRQGRRARTHYDVREVFLDAAGRPLVSVLNLVLETGRTHQVRVHLAHIGHPILGDATYGTSFRASTRRLGPRTAATLAVLGRQALHAGVLGFSHPRTGKTMRFVSAPPADIAAVLDALRGETGQSEADRDDNRTT